ncbi:bifunctional folylpolyglutamate synthase/dihydrofolate synthase [bacterium]|nr:bifunctional folylpolyglutamate synthase/dihydrofolate synthase [bacterium]
MNSNGGDDAARSETEAFLYGRLNYERQGLPGGSQGLGLRRMRRLMRALGDPQNSLRIVHVAGSKGKGSTCTLLAAGLSAAGHRTGLFCSPHLHTIRERYRIDGEMIEERTFLELTQEIRPFVERIDQEDPDGVPLTFFEITTAMGIVFFARRKCDAVVLEVGMGGRLDSTNIVRPVVSVITSISLEHTRQLGATTYLIAGEKAGIIKRNGHAVSGVRDHDARQRIREVASSRLADLKEVDRDYRFTETLEPETRDGCRRARIDVRTWCGRWENVAVPFLGPHQAENAALALATFDRMRELGTDVTRADVERGWKTLSLPARVEVRKVGQTTVVVDGAHSPASAEALAATLVRNFPRASGRQVLVFGTTREKDMPGQLRALLPNFDALIVTRYLSNPRSRPIDETCQAVADLGYRVSVVAEEPDAAMKAALELAGPEGRIVVTGSLFLAAEVRETLDRWTDVEVNQQLNPGK